MRNLLSTIILLAALALLGCGDRASLPNADAGADQGPAPDGSTSSSWGFEPEGSPQGAAVFIKAGDTVAGSEDTLWLDVVAQKIGSLQGVAFRLAFDPQQIEVLETEAGQAWELSSTKNVHRFAVRPEGELWAGLGHVGTGSMAAVSPVTIARVKVKLKGSSAITIGFRPHHNLVLDTQGSRVKAAWLGGELKRAAK